MPWTIGFVAVGLLCRIFVSVLSWLTLLGAVPDERVRDAARTMAFRAARRVFDPAKPGRACASVAELRDVLDRLGDAAGFADLYAGGYIEDVAALS